jgi:ribosome-binding protein aMBF1 (putative translation factor)
MKQSKRKKLERAGFKVGSVQEFLGLTEEEMELIELKLRLIRLLGSTRKSKGISQTELARRMSSSQSRVAKIEAGGADVTLDLICRALFALGLSRADIGRNIAKRAA